jgi:TonB family protein
MNCQEFATILDENAIAELPKKQESALAAHARGCKDCASALLAFRALRADAIPLPASASLVMPAATKRQLPRQAWRAGAVLGVLGLGGAVFAGIVHFYGANVQPSQDEVGSTPGEIDSPTAIEAADSTVPDALIAYVAAEERAANDEFGTALMNERMLPDGEYFSLLKVPPRYPAAAARIGLEGYAVVEFTITAEGDVADVIVVEASDPVFEEPSLESAAQFKYKPRVVGGKAELVSGARNRIAFALKPPAEATGSNDPEQTQPTSVEADTIDGLDFARLLAPVYECLKQDDLRCIELNLDQILATVSLNSGQESQLWHVYGFVHHRRGDYERAIEAYRKAAGSRDDDSRFLRSSQLMTVARIYYERHQYQPALDFAIESLKANRDPRLADYVFVDRLRQLGAELR